MTFLLIFYSVFGTLLAVISIPLILRKIKPNPFYGFRISETLENQDLWYAVNEHFGRRLFWIGLSSVVAAVGFYFIPRISLDIYALSVLGVFAVAFTLGLIQSFRFLRKIEKSKW